jgi:rod shape-determining protein MreD
VTPEPTAARRAVTGLVLFAALFAAVVLQLTVVNRLPLPGAGAPDLVLLLVTAVAVTTSPRCGAVSGFAAGLALDVAPPVTHYTGQDALVFCLAGYGAARVIQLVRDATGERDQLTSFAVMAAAAAAGEAAQAALGLLLADADMTSAVISRVLPSAVLYDLLLAAPAYWLAARITRGAPAETAPVPDFGARSLGGGARLAGAFRQASAGAAPGLRLAGSGANYQRLAARPVPRLQLSGQRTPADARTGAGSSGPRSFPLAGGRTPRLNFAGQRPARVAGRQARVPSGRPGRSWLRTAARPARSGLVGGGVAGSSLAAGRRARGGRGGSSPVRKPATMTSAAFRSAPLRTASGRAARSRAARTGLGRTRRPGWLGASGSGRTGGSRAAYERSRSGRPRFGRSGFRGAGFGGSALGRSGGRGYGAAPSRSWARRSRSPWRRRRQRLLRLVGVGR